MPQDPTVQVAVVGIVTTFITTIGVLVVAVMNNKKERASSAGEGVASTLRERIKLRDEQIVELRQDLLNLEEKLRKVRMREEDDGPSK